MFKKRLAVVTSLILIFMGVCGSAQAVDIFVSADAIKGEANSRSYVDKIEVNSFNLEIKSSLTSGPVKGASKVNFPAFKLTKKVDLSSNQLLTSLVTGKIIKSFVVDFVRSDGAGSDFVYLRHTFSDVTASDYSFLVNKEDEEGGVETISFVYSKISTEYFYQDRAGKKVSGPKFGFDLGANKLL